MRYYTPTVKTKLVADVVAAWVRSELRLPPVFDTAMTALDRDLQRVNYEEAKIVAEEAAEEARKHPALTVQKVGGILRKAGLSMSSYDNRAGRDEGIVVEYGDYTRINVKVSYAFPWNFAFNHNIKGGPAAEKVAMKKLIDQHLYRTAMTALVDAGLKVGFVNDPNPHLARLVVKL